MSLNNKLLTYTIQVWSEARLSKSMRSEIIKEYDLTPSSFDKWVKQARTTGSFKTVDNLTDEQRELIELRKRNKELEMQLDILTQAAVIKKRKGK